MAYSAPGLRERLAYGCLPHTCERREGREHKNITLYSPMLEDTHRRTRRHSILFAGGGLGCCETEGLTLVLQQLLRREWGGAGRIRRGRRGRRGLLFFLWRVIESLATGEIGRGLRQPKTYHFPTRSSSRRPGHHPCHKMYWSYRRQSGSGQLRAATRRKRLQRSKGRSGRRSE